jgi:hypothetical protein
MCYLHFGWWAWALELETTMFADVHVFVVHVRHWRCHEVHGGGLTYCVEKSTRYAETVLEASTN